MSLNTAWKCLLVEDFVSKCNWDNLPLQKPELPFLNRPKKALTSWQSLLAEDFFSLNNWSGQTTYANNLEDVAQQDLVEPSIVFDLTLTTEQFWQCWNWSGKLNTFKTTEVEETINQADKVIAAVDEFTLNNLSQLF